MKSLGKHKWMVRFTLMYGNDQWMWEAQTFDRENIARVKAASLVAPYEIMERSWDDFVKANKIKEWERVI